MRGTLFKYDADPEDNLLRDKRDIDICEGFVDPDFWSNPFPVWSICGPTVRQTIRRGDIVFFLPKKDSYELAGYKDYLCSGILVVERVVAKNIFLSMPELNELYKQNYLANLGKHVERDWKDAFSTSRVRGDNIVIGKVGVSKWFGKNDVVLRDALTQLHFELDLSLQRINKLSIDQCRALYQFYMKHF